MGEKERIAKTGGAIGRELSKRYEKKIYHKICYILLSLEREWSKKTVLEAIFDLYRDEIDAYAGEYAKENWADNRPDYPPGH